MFYRKSATLSCNLTLTDKGRLYSPRNAHFFHAPKGTGFTITYIFHVGITQNYYPYIQKNLSENIQGVQACDLIVLGTLFIFRKY